MLLYCIIDLQCIVCIFDLLAGDLRVLVSRMDLNHCYNKGK
jgi:hypothetical protein